jgi:hypothetical protein
VRIPNDSAAAAIATDAVAVSSDAQKLKGQKVKVGELYRVTFEVITRKDRSLLIVSLSLLRSLFELMVLGAFRSKGDGRAGDHSRKHPTRDSLRGGASGKK